MSLLRRGHTMKVVTIPTPLHYWRLDSNANDSAGTAHGTLIDNPTLVTGKVNDAYSFNGTSQYMTVDINKVNLPSIMTALCWAKSNTVNWNHSGFIVSCRSGNGFIIHPNNGTKVVRPYIFNSLGNTVYASVDIVPTDITLWHQYGVIWDGKKVHSIFDGTIIGSATHTISREDQLNDAALQIGRDLTNRYGNLVVDEVATWDRILTASEIAKIYNNGNGKPLL